MSDYTQLPPGTLDVLRQRARRGLSPGDYSDWASQALAAGFDSDSLAILAGMDQTNDPQEVAEYFIRAVKDLKLAIPDCELAFGNWDQTALIYRKLGLTLPDEWHVIGQHLVELARQIKAGALAPVVGLERIAREVVIYQYRYASDGVDWAILNRGGAPKQVHWDGDGLWAWGELADYIFYEDYEGRLKELDPDLIDQEIRSFAVAWLDDKQIEFKPQVAIREVLPESEWKPVKPAHLPPLPPQPPAIMPIVSEQLVSEVQEPVVATRPGPDKVKYHSEPPDPLDQLGGHAIRVLVMLALMALFFTGLWSLRKSISLGVDAILIVLGSAVIATIADKVVDALGFFPKKK